MRPAVRMTKIVATIGPACDAPETLRRMIEAGMNVARLNLSHGTFSEQASRAARVREAAAALSANVAIMADTRGVEIRTGAVQNGTIELQVAPCLSETGQNREAENRGISTTVAPTQNDASTE